ncbi:MAG: DUF5666 domain-containing protein [bacterium]|nr:DUF5666 domain-containing protein [bacterium]
MKNLIIAVVAAAAISGAASFFGGMKYAQSKNSGGFDRAAFQNMSAEERQQMFAQRGGGTSGGRLRGTGQNGGGFMGGEILSRDDKSLTIKLRDGESKIVFYSDSSEISQFVSGDSADLEVGKTVTINGTPNADGSITAQSIQIRPQPSPNPSP